jgi:carbon monoxide dehydrogenase subunit G
MGLSKYTSDIKFIDHNEEIVFNHLSNFEHLSQYINDGLLQKVSQKVPQINITNFESDQDSCRFSVGGMGQSEIRIIDREPFKTIKLQSSGSLPVEFTFWIQLMPVNANQTKMKLTLHAEMGMMIKMMAGNKLEEGINQLADMLTRLPYRQE